MSAVKDVAFGPKVRAACKQYDKKCEGYIRSKWERAAAAYKVKEAAEAEGTTYVKAAAALCKVSKATIVQDVKAETIRRALGIDPKALPLDSHSAMYELHLGRDLALKVAGGDEKKRKDAEEKVRKQGELVVKGAHSVREVRKAFAGEREEDRRQRRGSRPVPPKTDAAPAKTEKLDAEGLKQMVEQTVVPAGVGVPVLTIVPSDATPQALMAWLADEANRKAIAQACPTKGNLWLMVDFTAAEKMAKAAEQPNPETKTGRMTKKVKTRKTAAKEGDKKAA